MNNYYQKYQKYKTKYYQLKFNQYGGNIIDHWSMVDQSMTTILYIGNEPIPVNVLPNGLTTLKLGDEFNHPIGPNILPSGLTNLTFGDNFNQPIGSNILPSSLKFLKFGNKFDQPIGPNSLPEGLTLLKFGNLFNQSLDHFIPTELVCLILGTNFNQHINPSFYPLGLNRICFRYPYRYQNEIPPWVDIHYGLYHSSCEYLDLDQLVDIDPIYDPDFDYSSEPIRSVPSIRRGSNELSRVLRQAFESKQNIDRNQIMSSQQQERTNLKSILTNRLEIARSMDKSSKDLKQLGDEYQNCPICDEPIQTTNSPDEYLSSNCDENSVLFISCCQKFIHQCCADWYFKPTQLTPSHPLKSPTTCPLCRTQLIVDGKWKDEYKWPVVVSTIPERKAKLAEFKTKFSKKKQQST